MKRRNVETSKRRKTSASSAAAATAAPGVAAFRRPPVWMMLLSAALVFFGAPAFAQDAPAGIDAVEEEVALEEPGEPPAPPANLIARDHPNDAGRAIILSWELSPDDDTALTEVRVSGYRLYRARYIEGEEPNFERVADITDLAMQTSEWTDARSVRPNIPYVYRLTAVSPDGVESPAAQTAEPVEALRWFFDRRRGWFLLITLVLSVAIIAFIYLARRGVTMRIRKIAGLEAVDEAVGRATEMGRSILFVPGIQDMNNIQTVAGITVLARIGRTAAEYDAHLEVPTSRSLVMTTARETLESSFLAAGRPDAYHEDMSYYVTDEQFGYVAYLTGYMVRNKPAACFYLGAFFAESLILAETGNSIGAIQVAGTAEPAQLPFFVAACDYTLIGEEFFAASAYLSGEPEQLGSLKGQDIGKVVLAALIVFGCVVATLASFAADPDGWAAQLTEYLRSAVLG